MVAVCDRGVSVMSDFVLIFVRDQVRRFLRSRNGHCALDRCFAPSVPIWQLPYLELYMYSARFIGGGGVLL